MLQQPAVNNVQESLILYKEELMKEWMDDANLEYAHIKRW